VAYPVTHFEINAQDAPATQKFYSDLFGWGIDADNPDNYGVIDTRNKGTGINGGIGASQQGRSWVTFYVECDDPAATLAKVERLGGRRVMEPMTSMNVTYALFADPEGNVIGLAKMDRSREQQHEQETRSRSNGNGSAPKSRAKATTAKASSKRATARKRTTAKTAKTAKKSTARSRSKRSRG
jgi:predicted enzyme related to lactoylglutathione lyase